MWKVTHFLLLGKFGPTLEDVLNLIALPLYGETNAIGATSKEEDEDKLQWLVASIGHSMATSSSKFVYASWILFDKGDGSYSEPVLRLC